MRVIFMGTPEFAVPTLTKLYYEPGHEILACYTRPPRSAGRKLAIQKSPIHKKADSLGIAVNTPVSFRDESVMQSFRNYCADVVVVVAYGILLPNSILQSVKFGCLNLHPSLLPRWRGAAPINRAIMAGDTVTGIEVMKMEESLDTGPIYMKKKIAIDQDMTAGELHDNLADLGGSLMVKTLAKLELGEIVEKPQVKSGVKYAKKIYKSEAKIDWKRNAEEIHNKIRGLSPYPGAWCEIEILGKMERVKILRSKLEINSGQSGQLLDDNFLVACRSGAIRILELQRAGKRKITGEQFLRGVDLLVGTMIH